MSANVAAGIFFVLGLGVSYYGYRLIRKARASAQWPAVQGKIESSTVDVEREREEDSDGDIHYERKYIPNIVYQYQVDGMDFMGDQISFGSTSSSSQGWAYKMRDQYPEGAEVAVYYDPENPQEAVLQPGAKGATYIVMVIGVVFVLTGILIFFVV